MITSRYSAKLLRSSCWGSLSALRAPPARVSTSAGTTPLTVTGGGMLPRPRRMLFSTEKGAPTPETMHSWIAKHYAKTTVGVDITSSTPPSKEDKELYTAALLLTCGADGFLHPLEKDWIMGHQAAFGTSPDIMGEADNDGLVTKYTLDDLVSKFENSPTLQYTKRCLIFHCISACSADGEFAPLERKAVEILATALKLSTQDIDELLDLYNQQQELNDKIISTLWKAGNAYNEK